MKIAFVGKGGSGKTTISALFSRYSAHRGIPVLAIDSDINQHLAGSLGAPHLTSEMPALGVEIRRLQSYVKGDNPRVPLNDLFVRTTPPGRGSRFLTPHEDNELYRYFSRIHQGIRLLAVGQPPQDQVGQKCYHSNMAAAEIFLNHLVDKDDDLVVVDLTAGIDTLISGMFVSYDIIFVVVEPTIKSVSVFNDYKKYLDEIGHPVTIAAIANKVHGTDDALFIEQHIKQKPIACFGRSDFVQAMEKGQVPDIATLEQPSQQELERVLAFIRSHRKDWQRFYDGLILFHKKKAQGSTHPDTLLSQIDPEFIIHHVVS